MGIDLVSARQPDAVLEPLLGLPAGSLAEARQRRELDRRVMRLQHLPADSAESQAERQALQPVLLPLIERNLSAEELAEARQNAAWLAYHGGLALYRRDEDDGLSGASHFLVFGFGKLDPTQADILRMHGYDPEEPGSTDRPAVMAALLRARGLEPSADDLAQLESLTWV